MKFIGDKKSLLKVLSIAQEVLSSKNTFSLMSCVLLESKNNAVVLKATDGATNLKTAIAVQDLQQGNISSTAVFCDPLYQLINQFPDSEIYFEIEKKVNLITKTKKGKYNLNTLSPENFPDLPEFEDLQFFSIPAKEFKRIVNATLFAVSTDETRYFMTGVYMAKENDTLVFVTTDSRRLALTGIKTDIANFNPVIIPPKILHIVSRHCLHEGNIELAIKDSSIIFKFGNLTLASKLIEGQFPNYKKVIPETQDFTVIINRQEFYETVTRGSIFTDQESKKIILDLSQNKLIIKTEGQNTGDSSEELDCLYEGSDISLAFNNRFLIEPLKTMECEKIVLTFTSATKAIILREEPKSETFYIIMPMQI